MGSQAFLGVRLRGDVVGWWGVGVGSWWIYISQREPPWLRGEDTRDVSRESEGTDHFDLTHLIIM